MVAAKRTSTRQGVTPVGNFSIMRGTSGVQRLQNIFGCDGSRNHRVRDNRHRIGADNPARAAVGGRPTGDQAERSGFRETRGQGSLSAEPHPVERPGCAPGIAAKAGVKGEREGRKAGSALGVLRRTSAERTRTLKYQRTSYLTVPHSKRLVLMGAAGWIMVAGGFDSNVGQPHASWPLRRW